MRPFVLFDLTEWFWYLSTAIFGSASALSNIDHNGKNWMIEWKPNQKLLSISTTIFSNANLAFTNLMWKVDIFYTNLGTFGSSIKGSVFNVQCLMYLRLL